MSDLEELYRYQLNVRQAHSARVNNTRKQPFHHNDDNIHNISDEKHQTLPPINNNFNPQNQQQQEGNAEETNYQNQSSKATKQQKKRRHQFANSARVGGPSTSEPQTSSSTAAAVYASNTNINKQEQQQSQTPNPRLYSRPVAPANTTTTTSNSNNNTSSTSFLPSITSNINNNNNNNPQQESHQNVVDSNSGGGGSNVVVIPNTNVVTTIIPPAGAGGGDASSHVSTAVTNQFKKSESFTHDFGSGGSSTTLVEKKPRSLQHPAIPVASHKPRTSKLELEVQRLEAAGTLLVQRSGEEVAGLILLEKAIFSRTRFASLAKDVWRRAEQLVVLCCQIVFRLTQQCEESALSRCKELLRTAERVLNPPPPPPNSLAPVSEPFDGFDILKRSLIASVRIAYTVVLSLQGNESAETIVTMMETALQAEQPRPGAATLYNLAVAYVNAGRFDEAAACVVRCIDLVSHYTTMHLNLTRETEPPFRAFLQENATYSVLCHHLVASIGQWCNMEQLTLQHAILALRCAERCLGSQHALTSRCAQFVRSLEMARMSLGAAAGSNSSASFLASMTASSSTSNTKNKESLLSGALKQRKDTYGAPPRIPFQMSAFTSEFLPSLLIPFTLVQSHPIGFELPSNSVLLNENARVPAPLLYVRGGTEIDATTARKMAGDALRSAKQQLRKSAAAAAGTGTTTSTSSPVRHHPASTSTSSTSMTNVVLPGQTKSTPFPKPKPPIGSKKKRSNSSSSVNNKMNSSSSSIPQAHHHQQQQNDSSSLQQQEQQESDGGDSASSPKFLSVIPLRDYDLYNQLQGEVASLVSSTEFFVATELNKRRQNQVSLLRLPNVPKEVVTTKYLDSIRQLRGMSHLRPDHTLTDEQLWNIAAFRLQKFMRRFIAELHVSRRQAAISRLIKRHLAADKIYEAWILYQLRQAAKRKLNFLRQKRSEFECLEMLQAYLRFHQSIEHFAGHYLNFLKFQLWMKRHATQMQLGATLIQSVWRSHASRGVLLHKIHTVTRIQRFYRKFRLYLAMRLAVFRRRQRRRAFFGSLQGAASKLQHWFRREIVRVHALRELRRRQKLRDGEFTRRYDAEWSRYEFFRDANEQQCGMRILHFFRACIWRRNEGERLRRSLYRHAAATIVRRSFLRFKCRKLKSQNKKDEGEKMRIMKRREEVREAVLDLQRYGRGLLDRASVYVNLRKAAEKELAAKRLQRFSQVVFARVERRRLAQRAAFEANRYQLAAIRQFSVLQIQCAWRRFIAKKFVAGYATFMTQGRFGLVTKIQRAYRRHRARVKYAAMALKRQQDFEQERQFQVQDCAAKRIQRAFRSALQMRMGKQFAVSTVFELNRLNRAASLIQRRWRYALSRLIRFEFQQVRDSEIAIRRGEEHRVMGAIVLQRWARSRFLLQKQKQEAQPDLERRMALRIQGMVRCFFGRKKLAALQLTRDELWRQDNVVKEEQNAAIMIQKNYKMHLARGKYQLRQVAAKLIQDSWKAVFELRNLKTKRIMNDYEGFLKSQAEADAEQEKEANNEQQ